MQSITLSFVTQHPIHLNEQNVLLVRYVHHDKEGSGLWKVLERFIEFKNFHKKTGQEISEIILEALKANDIHIQDCRGQGYDNGANMSGKVKGVQAQILKVNPLATFSPCASHTLNLVGVHAAESCPEVATFFGSVNRLYNLFSVSPQRWAILKENRMLPSSSLTLDGVHEFLQFELWQLTCPPSLRH